MNMPEMNVPLGAARTYEPLFQPININRLNIANRLVLGPVAAHSPAADGRPSEETIAFFETRAKGGVGLIIVGGSTSTEQGWNGAAPSTRYMLRLDRDDYDSDLRRLTDRVHARGVPIFAQINTSMGRMGKPGPDFMAASAVNVVIPESSLAGVLVIPGGITLPPPRAATVDEIQRLERETADSALRMRQAGFDGVELGAHMSYFMASFLSSRTNLRTDQYGGSVDNRVRMLVNTLRLIRAGAGDGFPVGVRMTANEHTPGGQGPQEYAAIARALEHAGIDYIALTDGAYESMNVGVTGDASLIRHGETLLFREAVKIPLMLPGVHDPVKAAEALSAGHADMIMLVRPLLADPEYAVKVLAGRANQIVRCNGENYCLKRLMLNMPIRCPVNPRLGNETTEAQAQRSVITDTVESAVLKLSGSRFFMRQMGRLAARRAKRH